MLTYFITSDTHSYYSLLIEELSRKGFGMDNPNHVLVLCGDAFDRNAEAVKMFNFMRKLQSQGRLIYIRGNHEDLLFDCVKEMKENYGCASSHHYSNGTVDTVIEFNNAHMLNDVLDFISKFSVDYYELDNYIFCHGWVPIVGQDSHSSDGELSAMLSPRMIPISDEIAGKKARWLNGMSEWHKGNKLDNKTVVCGHWHCSYGNYQYHNIGSGEFESDSSFEPFIDDGIIALDACTAYSNKINIFILNSVD